MDTPTTLDPAEWTAAIEHAFLDHIPAPDQVRRRLAVLHEQLRPLVRNPMDAANVRFTLLAVAAFDVLESSLGPDEAVAVVDRCLNGPFRDEVLAGTAQMLDHAPDAFTALVAASKDREATYFGPSFTFGRPVDDDTAYILDITRCLFHDALAAVGRTRLQPVLCRFDLNWADAIDPDRHGVRFVRPVTFATGDTCRMCFLRQERVPGP